MSGAKLSKEINDGLTAMMAKLAQETLPEYDSSQLSDIQKEIVMSDKKNIIVVAGAGSGKTRVLTERIKYLVKERKVDPSNIVSITFTNMAADINASCGQLRRKKKDGDTYENCC